MDTSTALVANDDKTSNFFVSVECSQVEALEAATLHPAQLLGIEKSKGTLDFGSDADFVLLDSQLNVHATYIAGKLVWKLPDLTLPETFLDVK